MSDVTDILAPMNGEGTRATVLRWCKQVGDCVKKDEPLLELETDKVSVEIPSPADGRLLEVLKAVDAEVLPDEVLARLGPAGQSPATASVATTPQPQSSTAAPSVSEGRTALSPAVRRLLHQNAVDSTHIEGTGRSGRITAQDVIRHINAQSSQKIALTHPQAAPADREIAQPAQMAPSSKALAAEQAIAQPGQVAPSSRALAADQTIAQPAQMAPSSIALAADQAIAQPGQVAPSSRTNERAMLGAMTPPSRMNASAAKGEPSGAGSRLVPHTAIRRRVADHMSRSLAAAPHVTTLFEVDLTRVLAHRARHAAAYESRAARLTLTAYFISACAHALRAHPEVNATFHADAMELHGDVNIGIGTALGDKGLIVPVIHRAQSLNLFGLAQRLGQLVEAARGGKLAPDEVRGGTFTISNHGVGGSVLASPIVINQPQVAILGVGKVERRVCVIEADGVEAIGVRSRCYLTLTIDHRALDAFQANAFLSLVAERLETWPEEDP